MSVLRELCRLDDPSVKLRSGEIEYADLFRVLCDLELPEEEARSVFGKITAHEADLSARMGKRAGFRLALMDYFLNVDKRFAFPRMIECDRYEQIIAQCARDPLTGILNRRHFDYQAERELMRSKRYGYALSLVFFDLDDFKTINDTFGHAAGDAVLRETAGILQKSLRTEDAAARFGGEEFVLLLPQTDISGARTIAQRLLDKVRSHPYGAGIRVSFSGGAASFPRHGDTVKELLEMADRGLYEAKMLGKNRIVVVKEGRRENKRYMSVMPLTFEVGSGAVHGGMVRDISLSGLAMETDWEPREGQEISLRFYVEDGERMYEFRARIVWAVKLGSQDRFTFGVRYTAEDDPRIMKAVSALAMSSPRKREGF